VQFCVLCGCDYLPRIPNVGEVKALDLVVKYNTTNADIRIAAICRELAAKDVVIPEGYVDAARRAEAVFFYHPIWDGEECRPLMPRDDADAASASAAAAASVAPHVTDISFLGVPPTAAVMAALTAPAPLATAGAVLAFQPHKAAAARAAASAASAAAASAAYDAVSGDMDALMMAEVAERRAKRRAKRNAAEALGGSGGGGGAV